MFEIYKIKNGRKKLDQKIGIALGAAAIGATLTFAYASERTLRQDEVSKVNPGVATFDPAIQKISERVLHSALAKSDALAGFVLVSDPNTGRLLAAANEIRDQTIIPPRKNWSLGFRMMPGSTIKPIVAAAALEKEVTTMNESHFCEKGSYNYGGRIYHDHSPFDHLTTAQTIAHSSDICSIKIAQKLGPAELEKSVLAFGFGNNGVAQSFPEAFAGSVPKYSDLPIPQYIQMISVGGAETRVEPQFRMYSTPLELLYAYGAIANGGKLMKPLLYSSNNSNVQVIRKVLSPKNSDELKSALTLAVKDGTGTQAESELYTTAGKTSTGHFQRTEDPKSKLDENTDFGGFVGFAPVNSPKISVYAVVFAPKHESVFGGRHAAPLFREVTDEVLQYLKVAPDKK